MDMKVCSRCNEPKDVDHFHADKRSPDGRQSRCKLCRNGHRRATHNPARHRANNLRLLYGITDAEYAALLAQQGGVCAICGRTDKRPLAVDHCHTTGKVRGLLCVRCNTAIGSFEDDLTLIASAAAYVGRHTPNVSQSPLCDVDTLPAT